jgi:hypothetical protein
MLHVELGGDGVTLTAEDLHRVHARALQLCEARGLPASAALPPDPPACAMCVRAADLVIELRESVRQLPQVAVDEKHPVARQLRILRGAGKCSCGRRVAVQATEGAATPEGYYDLRGEGRFALSFDEESPPTASLPLPA